MQFGPFRAASGESVGIWLFRYAGDPYNASRNSGREISNSGPEMCTNHLVVWNHKKQCTKWSRIVAGDAPCFSSPSQTCWARKTNSRSGHPRSNNTLKVFRSLRNDNKICTFKLLLSWRGVFPRTKKTCILDGFPLCPQCPPSSEMQFLFLLSSHRLWDHSPRKKSRLSICHQKFVT